MKKTQRKFPRLSPQYPFLNGETHFGWSLGAVVGTMASGAIALSPLVAHAESLTQWSYDPTANRLEVTVGEGITPRYFLMAQPARIVLDLPDTAVGNVQAQASYLGAVRQIRVSQFQPGLTRIVLELSPEVELAPRQVKLEKVNHPAEASRWVLQPLLAQSAPLPPTAKVPPIPVTATATSVASDPLPSAPSGASVLPTSTLSGGTDAKPQAPFPVEKPESISVASLVPPTTAIPSSNAQVIPLAPAKVVQAEKILPPPTPIPIGSDDGLKDPGSSPVTQALPPASATPLSPGTSPSELAIDTRNAIQISVPPPLSGSPTKPPIALSATTTSLPPASISPPANIPPAAVVPSPGSVLPPVSGAPVVPPAPPVAVSGASPTPGILAMDMPTTVRVAPEATPRISVPPLTNLPSGSNSSPSSSAPPISAQPAPLPVPMQLSPLSPLPGAARPTEQAAPIAVPPPVQSVPATASPMMGVPAAQTPVAPFPAASVVPLPSAPTSSLPVATSPTTSAKPEMVAFGQPLPTTGAIALNTFPRGVATYPTVPSSPPMAGSIQPTGVQPESTTSGGLQPGVQPSSMQPSVQQAYFQSSNPAVLIPLGATLNLVYPGTSNLKLPSGPPLQEVLLLQSEVRDASGNVVFPQGTYVIGRFDASGGGSKFIAQAIAIGSSTIPFAAESNLLGNSRGLNTTTMAIGSGVGALLGGAVSSFSGMGLVGGAAAGAATSLLVTPKQVTVQPGQVIPVQVKQDVFLR